MRTTDFAVITIVEDAHRLARKIFAPVAATRGQSGRIYLSGFVPPLDSKSPGCRVAIAYSRDQSHIPMTKLAVDLLEDLQPRFVLILDIGGGIAGRHIDLGDIAVSDDIHYYGHVKQSEEGESERPLVIELPSRKLLEVAQNIQQDWYTKMGEKRPDGGSKPPKARFGLVLCADELKGNPHEERLRRLLKRYPEAIAFDMESAGVARAFLDARLSPRYKPIEYLVVRGISDYVNKKGNQNTRRKWRSFAAEAALAFGYRLIQESYIQVAPAITDTPEQPFEFNEVGIEVNVKNRAGTKVSYAMNYLVRNVTQSAQAQFVVYFFGDVPRKWAQISPRVYEIDAATDTVDELYNSKIRPEFLREDPYTKRFVVKFRKPVYPGQERKLRVEYEWDNPQHYWEYTNENRPKFLEFKVISREENHLRVAFYEIDKLTQRKILSPIESEIVKSNDESVVTWRCEVPSSRIMIRAEWQ